MRVDRASRRAVVDFTDSSPQQSDNFNAPQAVTRAAVLYVLWTLVADDILLNNGGLAPVNLVIPRAEHAEPALPGRGR